MINPNANNTKATAPPIIPPNSALDRPPLFSDVEEDPSLLLLVLPLPVLEPVLPLEPLEPVEGVGAVTPTLVVVVAVVQVAPAVVQHASALFPLQKAHMASRVPNPSKWYPLLRRTIAIGHTINIQISRVYSRLCERPSERWVGAEGKGCGQTARAGK